MRSLIFSKTAWLATSMMGIALVLVNNAQMAQAESIELSKPVIIAQPQRRLAPAPRSPNSLTYGFQTYYSSVLGMQRSYGIVLPAEYNQQPNRRYPVIFLLHGGHGTQTDWLQEDKGNAVPTLQRLYASGQLLPSIVITPDGNDKRGSSPYWDPDYSDGANGQVATAIGEELVGVVQQRYRTLPAPDFWAIGGLSSGGWGAMNIGLHFLKNFTTVFSHSGYFVDPSGPQNSPLDLVKTLSVRDRQRLRIYLDAGRSDPDYLGQTQTFHRVLDQEGIANNFQAFEGEHGWEYWRSHLADSLSFVGKQFQTAQMTQKN